MIRALHRWPGLLALALVTILSSSGAALSVFPAAERIAAPQVEAGLTVAVLADRIQAVYPGVEQIRRSPSGRITAYWFDQGAPGAAVIDPATGEGVGSADPNQTQRWLTNLHRSLFLGDGGRIAMAAAAAAMLVLSLSGAALVARRAGGWRHWFAVLRGPLAGRLHVEIARTAVVGLVLSSTTALWMTASTFDLLPDGGAMPAAPAEVSGEAGFAPGRMTTLRQTPVSELRELSFPYPGDATDVFTLKTDRGTGYLDQGDGALLAWADMTGMGTRLGNDLHAAHRTGRGDARLRARAHGARRARDGSDRCPGLARRAARPAAHPGQSARRSRRDDPARRQRGRQHLGLCRDTARRADASWAERPCRPDVALRAGTLPSCRADHPARRDLWRWGGAGHGAGFSRPAERVRPGAGHATRGARFRGPQLPGLLRLRQGRCGSGQAKGWPELLPLDTIDRQSPQDFARWGRALGDVLGIELELSHQPVQPQTTTLTLVSRRDYGAEVQAPTAILRFALPRVSLWQRLTGAGFARFRPAT